MKQIQKKNLSFFYKFSSKSSLISLFSKPQKQNDIDVRCGCPSSTQKKTLSWYLMIIMLFIPVIIITWCYIKIIKSAKFLAKKLGESRTRGRSIGSTPKMKRPSPCSSESGSTTMLHFASSQNTIRKPRTSTTTAQNNNRQKRMSEFNSNLNLMVFLMVVAVVVCWLPFHVVNLSWAYGLRVRLKIISNRFLVRL